MKKFYIEVLFFIAITVVSVAQLKAKDEKDVIIGGLEESSFAVNKKTVCKANSPLVITTIYKNR